jgi:hypothetical protein
MTRTSSIQGIYHTPIGEKETVHVQSVNIVVERDGEIKVCPNSLKRKCSLKDYLCPELSFMSPKTTLGT